MRKATRRRFGQSPRDATPQAKNKTQIKLSTANSKKDIEFIFTTVFCFVIAYLVILLFITKDPVCLDM
jgi:hypothetical protein